MIGSIYKPKGKKIPQNNLIRRKPGKTQELCMKSGTKIKGRRAPNLWGQPAITLSQGQETTRGMTAVLS
jgi:hypothetical protein